MKSSSRMAASNPLLSLSVRQLLLLCLLTCGFLLTLPSLQAAATPVFESGTAERDRAERLFASDSFLVTTNDLVRVLRSDSREGNNDDSGDQPVLPGSAGDIGQPVTLAAAVVVSALAISHPLPVRTLPGAPRAPPAFPL
jgi:hypothetical protein